MKTALAIFSVFGLPIICGLIGGFAILAAHGLTKPKDTTDTTKGQA